MAVVTAFELDQEVAPRIAARQPDGAHRRLGAGADEAYHIHRRDEAAQQVGQFDLAFGRRAERQAVGGSGLYGGNDFRMGMAENQRPPRADVIEIFVTIDIRGARAVSADEKTRRPPHRAKGAHG